MSEQKICPVCGKPIVSKGSNAQKYCSEKCRRAANRNDERIVEHNKGMAEIQDKVIAAYHGECAICGWRVASCLIASKDGKIQWRNGNKEHHIDQVNEGGRATADNLILLCPNHHMQADLGLISKEELHKHQKPVPLPKEEVERDVANIERAIEEYGKWYSEHPDAAAEESMKHTIKLIAAWDLAVMLGNAGLIRGYYDAHQKLYIPIEDLKSEIIESAKETAKNDTGTNRYPVKKSNFYDIMFADDNGRGENERGAYM